MCYHREDLEAAIWNKRRNHHRVHVLCRVYELITGEKSPWGDTVVKSYFAFCGVFLHVWPLKDYSLHMTEDCCFILCLPPQNKWWGTSIMNSLNLKAHTQCCSHCLNSHKEHVTMATALHWQNIVLIWDTHKGESDLNTRQFRIPKLWNWYSSQK